MTSKTYALAIAYVASIVAGVWAVDAIGVVPVGFGLMAPAAVYFVGLTLIFRDLVQETGGKRFAILLVVIGALLSALLSPQLALASGVAFLVSELIDLVVYTRLRRNGLVLAMLGSNAVSIVIDSLIFLSIAFGSLEFLPGQIVGKALASVVAVGALVLIRRAR